MLFLLLNENSLGSLLFFVLGLVRFQNYFDVDVLAIQLLQPFTGFDVDRNELNDVNLKQHIVMVYDEDLAAGRV
jgi:hypothetical protein